MCRDFRVDKDGVAQARKLIDAGKYDDEDGVVRGGPLRRRRERRDRAGRLDGFGAWHLGVNPDASEGTKKRFAFPYGDFKKVNRAALIHGKQRAVQNDHDEIDEAADDLLRRLDGKRSS